MVNAIKNKLSKETVKMIKTSSIFFLEKVYNLHSIFLGILKLVQIRQKENSNKDLSKQIRLNSDSQQLMIRSLRSYNTKGLLYALLRRDLLFEDRTVHAQFFNF